MLARISKIWIEFQYAQETRHNSLFHFWGCLEQWWACRPRVVHCAFCGVPMWWNGTGDDVYCGPDCATYGPLAERVDEDELPF